MCAVQLVNCLVQPLGIGHHEDSAGIVIHVVEVVAGVSGWSELEASRDVDFLLEQYFGILVHNCEADTGVFDWSIRDIE